MNELPVGRIEKLSDTPVFPPLPDAAVLGEVTPLLAQIEQLKAEVERLTAECDALREALASVATGLRTFVPSHENSEAFARECDAALESDGQP